MSAVDNVLRRVGAEVKKRVKNLPHEFDLLAQDFRKVTFPSSGKESQDLPYGFDLLAEDFIKVVFSTCWKDDEEICARFETLRSGHQEANIMCESVQFISWISSFVRPGSHARCV